LSPVSFNDKRDGMVQGERWFPGPDIRDGLDGVSVAVLGHQL
jgi:hypothetical protein